MRKVNIRKIKVNDSTEMEIRSSKAMHIKNSVCALQSLYRGIDGKEDFVTRDIRLL